MSVVLFTATWRQDFDRFKLLRASLRELGIADSYHHVVGVHTEDIDLFSKLSRDSSVTVIPTSALLLPRLERRRRARNHRRTHLRHWVPGGVLAGWYTQQLTKLAGTLTLAGDVVIHIDSDVVFLKTVSDEDFLVPDGTPKLYVDADMRSDGSDEWNATAAKLLGFDVDPFQTRQYIHFPAVLDATLTRTMCEFIETRYSLPWQLAMTKANSFEYPTYGIWADATAADRVCRSSPMPSAWFTSFAQMWNFRNEVRQLIDTGTVKVLAVQSALHIPPDSYVDVVEHAWKYS